MGEKFGIERGSGELKPSPGERRESNFASLTQEQQEIELERALYLIQVAEEHEISLSARDVAIILGYEDEGSISRIWNLIKERLPLLKGRRERFEMVVGHIQEKALFENQEFDESRRFSEWLGQFKASELEQAQLRYDRISDGMVETPLITITTEDGRIESFELSNLLNLSEEQLAKLPEHIRQELEIRRKFWERYGITSGPELKSFLEHYFSRKEIRFEEEKDPIELKWLREVYPEEYDFLKRLREQGATIHLVACLKSPESVLSAVRHIAVESQHKFVSTWLPDLIREGLEPVVSREDIKEIERQSSERLKTAETIQPRFRRALIEKLFGEELARRRDFLQSIEQIEGFTPFYMSIEVSGGNLSMDDISRIREINREFDRGIGREYALRKLLFDDANGVSEEAQNIIKAMAIVGPAAHVLEHFFHLPGFAKFLAASADDMMSEWAEISALRGAGVTWKEIRQRFKFLAPAIPVAFALAGIVEPARKMSNERLAGAIFSSAAVFLSAVTCALSVKMFAEEYRRLAQEGKLREFFAPIDEEKLAQIKKLAESKVTSEDIWKAIEESLRNLGEDEESIEEKKKLFFRFAHSKEGEEIFAGLREPSFLERYRRGLKEAAGINPARFGIAFGAFSSPLFGFWFGPFFLLQPFLYALAGSYESVAGAGSVIGYKKIFPLLWNHYVRKRIKKDGKERIKESERK
jgi:hypothetical protein